MAESPPEVGRQTCTKCGVEKPLDDFSPHPEKRSGRQSWCKSCFVDRIQRRRRSDPDYVARQRALSNARYRALERLAKVHPAEFRALRALEQAKDPLLVPEHSDDSAAAGPIEADTSTYGGER